MDAKYSTQMVLRLETHPKKLQAFLWKFKVHILTNELNFQLATSSIKGNTSASNLVFKCVLGEARINSLESLGNLSNTVWNFGNIDFKSGYNALKLKFWEFIKTDQNGKISLFNGRHLLMANHSIRCFDSFNSSFCDAKPKGIELWFGWIEWKIHFSVSSNFKCAEFKNCMTTRACYVDSNFVSGLILISIEINGDYY